MSGAINSSPGIAALLAAPETVTVYFHGSTCPDGATAAAALALALPETVRSALFSVPRDQLAKQGLPRFDACVERGLPFFAGVHPNFVPLPETVEGRHVIMADLCMGLDHMEGALSVTVLDHHATGVDRMVKALCPSTAALKLTEYSVDARQAWALALSDRPGEIEDALRAELRSVASLESSDIDTLARAAATDLRHHVASKRQLGFGLHLSLDMARSGAQLAWDAVFPDEPRPPLVEYVADRDLWLWKLPDSRSVSAALDVKQAFATIADTVEWMTKFDAAKLAEQGAAYQECSALRVQRAVERSHQATLRVGTAVYRVQVAFEVGEHSSIGGALACATPKGADQPPDFAAVLTVAPRGTSVSLRSSATCTIDMSQVAKSFGGGGHKHAAGFSIQGTDFKSVFTFE